jgi:hypothetical protein
MKVFEISHIVCNPENDKWNDLLIWLTNNIGPIQLDLFTMPYLMNGDGWRIKIDVTNGDELPSIAYLLEIDSDVSAVHFKLTDIWCIV